MNSGRDRPSRGAFSLVLALMVLVAPPLEAQSGGLATGATHRVRVHSHPALGLEASMPRDGAYARGIQLDARADWQQSERAYARARAEFRRLLRQNARWERAVRGWITKAEFQRELSGRLVRLTQRSYRMTASSYFERAVAQHHKWRAIRAFAGRQQQNLSRQVEQDYKAAIQRGSHYYANRASLGLATLLHEIGDHSAARRLFARLRGPLPSWLALLEAQYHAAARESDKALAALERAVRYSSSFRRQALRSNSFDTLRADPRFGQVVGER